MNASSIAKELNKALEPIWNISGDSVKLSESKKTVQKGECILDKSDVKAVEKNNSINKILMNKKTLFIFCICLSRYILAGKDDGGPKEKKLKEVTKDDGTTETTTYKVVRLSDVLKIYNYFIDNEKERIKVLNDKVAEIKQQRESSRAERDSKLKDEIETVGSNDKTIELSHIIDVAKIKGLSKGVIDFLTGRSAIPLDELPGAVKTTTPPGKKVKKPKLGKLMKTISIKIVGDRIESNNGDKLIIGLNTYLANVGAGLEKKKEEDLDKIEKNIRKKYKVGLKGLSAAAFSVVLEGYFSKLNKKINKSGDENDKNALIVDYCNLASMLFKQLSKDEQNEYENVKNAVSKKIADKDKEFEDEKRDEDDLSREAGKRSEKSFGSDESNANISEVSPAFFIIKDPDNKKSIGLENQDIAKKYAREYNNLIENICSAKCRIDILLTFMHMWLSKNYNISLDLITDDNKKAFVKIVRDINIRFKAISLFSPALTDCFEGKGIFKDRKECSKPFSMDFDKEVNKVFIKLRDAAKPRGVIGSLANKIGVVKDKKTVRYELCFNNNKFESTSDLKEINLKKSSDISSDSAGGDSI